MSVICTYPNYILFYKIYIYLSTRHVVDYAFTVSFHKVFIGLRRIHVPFSPGVTTYVLSTRRYEADYLYTAYVKLPFPDWSTVGH